MGNSINEELNLLMENFESIKFINISKTKNRLWIKIYTEPFLISFSQLKEEIMKFLHPSYEIDISIY